MSDEHDAKETRPAWLGHGTVESQVEYKKVEGYDSNLLHFQMQKINEYLNILDNRCNTLGLDIMKIEAKMKGEMNQGLYQYDERIKSVEKIINNQNLTVEQRYHRIKWMFVE